MLRNRNVAVGKYYVDHGRKIAREIAGIRDNIVTFNTHHLDTGNSCPSSSECTLRDFIHWAEHEATASELSGLRYRQTEAILYAPQLFNADQTHLIELDTAQRSG